MSVISGYQLTEVIHEGVSTIIYRGTRQLDKKTVIIKVLTTASLTLAEISYIKHAYLIPQSLEIEGIVKPFSLETYQDGLALVLEDFGGIDLKKLLEKEPGQTHLKLAGK